MQEQLDALKVKVVGEAWRHTMDKAGDKSCTSYIVPSAPSAPAAGLDISVIVVANGSAPAIPSLSPVDDDDPYFSI